MAVILVAGSLRAQSRDSSPEWFEHTPDNAWLLPYDTTLISRRAFAELSYESHDDNFLNESDRHRLELGATRLWGPENQFAFSFSLEVPLVSESLDYKLVSGLAWHF